MLRGCWMVAGLMALAGCDDGASSDPAPDGGAADVALRDDQGIDPDGALADAADQDGPGDADVDAEIAGDGAVDVGPALDVGPQPDAMWLPPDPALERPPAAPFRVGAAIRRLPVPVGIGTSGFGPSEVTNRTPFARVYPGTRGVHTSPEVRVVVFEAGEGNRVILLRTDTVGITAQMRQAVVQQLVPRLGEAVDQQLIISATHTHSGPGRLIDKPLWRLIQDDFFPEFFERMRDTLAGAVEDALDDLQPAQVGHGLATTTQLHSDRRCENAEEEEPDLPFIRVDDLAGQTRALVVFHAVHGTVLGAERLLLSRDVSGGIEDQIAESFDHPVVVLFINGAAGDMGVGSPGQPADPEAPAWDGGFWRIEGVGQVAAAALRAAWDEVEMQAEGVVHSRTARAPIDRQILGYGPEFRYEFGAVYCGAGAEERCLGEPPHDNLTRACVPFPDEANSAPKQTPFTVGQIGERLFVTAPGEFSTALGRRAREAAAALTGLDDVVLMGYAQEYMGYSLPEDDWWQGGYESTGALWGPRQGDYLTGALISLARAYGNPRIPLSFTDQPREALPDLAYEPFPATPSAEGPAVLSDVQAQVASDQIVAFTFAGGDPWLGTPTVSLERETNEGFEPARGPDQRAYDSHGYLMTLTLATNPPYDEPDAATRTFAWTVELPALRAYGGGPDLRAGQFRFVARGQALVGGETVEYVVESGAFTVQGI